MKRLLVSFAAVSLLATVAVATVHNPDELITATLSGDGTMLTFDPAKEPKPCSSSCGLGGTETMAHGDAAAQAA